ncbi:hypothetical protein OOJ91_33915 [Micromonospora lupini]|uniref:hypothetical protein n=1 Tax=Micromonospora lupini TaxID=285679 RepID=UPI002257E442|nr:hypothetical protein [Micromonospora lupini]MCX5070845.1 hypothetical protein [Micromonospora lupini]
MTPDDSRRFWAQITEDTRRTALCHPSDADWIRALLAQHGMSEQILVEPTAAVDPGKVLLFDHNAAAAYERQAALIET